MSSISVTPPTRRAQALVNALLIALGLLGLALAADSILNTLAAAEERYTITGDRVALYNLAGQARLTPGTGSAVVVLVTRGGGDSAQLKIATGRIGDEQTLRVLYPGDEVRYSSSGRNFNTEVRVLDDGTFDHGHDGGMSGGRRVRISSRDGELDAHADLEIQVPKDQELKLHLAAGDVSVKNVAGTLLLATGSGDVTANDTRGKLKVDTGSGDVKITGVQGELAIDTGSGDVGLSGAKSERIKVDTGSGRIEASDVTTQSLDLDTGSGRVVASRIKTDQLRVETGSGSVDLGLLTPASQIDVDTGSGSVMLRVPSNLGADISFETGSGGFDSDLPVEMREIHHGTYRGRIGDGSARVVVETGSGSLRLAANQTK